MYFDAYLGFDVWMVIVVYLFHQGVCKKKKYIKKKQRRRDWMIKNAVGKEKTSQTETDKFKHASWRITVSKFLFENKGWIKKGNNDQPQIQRRT